MLQRQMSNAFYSALDLATRPFNGVPLVLPAQREHLGSILVRAAEALVLCDRLNFKVYGENLSLGVLHDFLGAKTLEALLEQKAISFVQWTPMIGLIEPYPGMSSEVLGLAAGTLTSPEYVDLQLSAEAGLRQWSSAGRRASL
jgi:hypothetical protein